MDKKDYKSVCYILDYWIVLIFNCFQVQFWRQVWRLLGSHWDLWGLFGRILLIKCVKDALRETLMGPRVVFFRFLMDFGVPAGASLESLFDTFCVLESQNADLHCNHIP